MLEEVAAGRDLDRLAARIRRFDELERPIAATMLLERLGTASAAERAAVLDALRQAGAIDLLVRSLHRRAPWRRALAARTLGQLGAADTVPELVERLSDGSHYVREAAVRALGRIGDERGLASLTDLFLRPGRAGAGIVYEALLASVRLPSRSSVRGSPRQRSRSGSLRASASALSSRPTKRGRSSSGCWPTRRARCARPPARHSGGSRARPCPRRCCRRRVIRTRASAARPSGRSARTTTRARFRSSSRPSTTLNVTLPCARASRSSGSAASLPRAAGSRRGGRDRGMAARDGARARVSGRSVTAVIRSARRLGRDLRLLRDLQSRDPLADCVLAVRGGTAEDRARRPVPAAATAAAVRHQHDRAGVQRGAGGRPRRAVAARRRLRAARGRGRRRRLDRRHARRSERRVRPARAAARRPVRPRDRAVRGAVRLRSGHTPARRAQTQRRPLGRHQRGHQPRAPRAGRDHRRRLAARP